MHFNRQKQLYNNKNGTLAIKDSLPEVVKRVFLQRVRLFRGLGQRLRVWRGTLHHLVSLLK
jgi:hypothetical protein